MDLDYLFKLKDILSWSIKCSGILGNLLTIVVFSQPSLRKLSISFYIRTLAVASIGDIVSTLYFEYFDPGINTSSFLCQLYYYLFYVFNSTSFGLLITIAFDRALTIISENRFQFTQKRCFQISATILIVFYNLAFYFSLTFYFYVKKIDLGYWTYFTCDSRTFDVFGRIYFVNSTALPSLCMIFSAIVIFLGIIRQIRKPSFKTQNQANQFRQNAKFGMIVICMSVLFLIMTIPYSLNFIYNINFYNYETEKYSYFLFGIIVRLLYESYLGLFFYVQFLINSIVRRETSRCLKLSFMLK